MVLSHVRRHYREAGLLIDDEDKSPTVNVQIPLLNIPKSNEYNNNVYMNNILSMCLPPNAGKLLLQQQQQQQQLQQATQQNGTVTMPIMVSIPMAMPIQNAPAIGVTATTAPSSTNNEHGETDEASSGGTSVNGGWRGPAPYRCGHCHQVSNWKHVIQVLLLTPHLQIHDGYNFSKTKCSVSVQ